MTREHSPQSVVLGIIACVILTLAGCGSTPPATQPAAPSTAAKPPATERFRVVLDGSFVLDYQIERQISKLNGKSCWAFITGSLTNLSQQTLSRRSVLDFEVMNQGRQLFRDLSNPVADIPPGATGLFSMVTSPVHKEGCPAYEKLNISLRKVMLK